MKKTYHLPPDLNGFTLIEILVVVAVTFILAAIMFGFSQKSRLSVALSSERTKLSQVIERARSLALSGVAVNPSDLEPPCAYGVHLVAAWNSYSLFRYNPPAPTLCDENISSLDTSPTNFQVLQNYEIISKKLKFGNPTDFTDILFLTSRPIALLFDSKNGRSVEPSVKIVIETLDTPPASTEINVSQNGQLSF
ncbi:MAG: prepilin-type N-terminal cleavage/methylation domain-containing protein [Candidatus Liptonbacteria bacterium]|nr:prepilin-type N-terminal cleavage/methylation domain-containing protein [Candidatus Liptonbacteria bacterium]